MKYSYIKVLVVASLIMGGCGGPKTSESIEEKKKLLATYKEERDVLEEQIKELEAEIVELNGPQKRELRLIEVEPVNTSVFNHFIEVPGEVKSNKNIQVNPEISGVILKRNYEEGAFVNQGAVIAVLSAEVLKKNIEEAETRLSLATSIYERQENLWNQNIGSEVQYLQAKNEKEALEKNVESLKEQLANAYVKAPISGTLDEYFMNTGEMATPQQPIARIVNLASVEINADVSEVYVKDVQKGDKVDVSFTAIGEEMKLPISAVGQFINPENRTFRINMKAPNKEGYLKPNTLAIVKINDYTKEDAITVPSHLIQKSTNGDSFLYTLESKDGKFFAKKVIVKPGKTYAGKTVIESGIKAGDKVIIKGYAEVVDGEEVNNVTNA
ncbi:efflux RND transporter periplasmic adaptor subunit [Chondrinema litorale]|uniref:efflux RND transporter periplasmic adaptor subunit n=1 Tax=Chondrinema litorale TaxID=2994555 RepID=UPI00254340B8|nr:efflux RND transporter periplasmic adaptor subunit [Chondrinema litorale]UZR95104.1 efflux RND transporter periplasmic adaptor subunit [Chondrinema litorale]